MQAASLLGISQPLRISRSRAPQALAARSLSLLASDATLRTTHHPVLAIVTDIQLTMGRSATGGKLHFHPDSGCKRRGSGRKWSGATTRAARWPPLLGLLHLAKCPLGTGPCEAIGGAGAVRPPDPLVELAPFGGAPAAVEGPVPFVQLSGSIAASRRRGVMITYGGEMPTLVHRND